LRKTIQKPLKEKRSTKLYLGSESRLCARKVLAPYNIYPKIVSLIKYAMECDFLECIFPKHQQKYMYKKQREYF